ncbi:vacuolar membrane PQ loop repeat protein [Lineolata rhizophorae]|uniref:Vacuolar membrane PQ loop repeat protein n=1 Tax=Lineolata rhizophorae TaxID=578093 RepID=A0A6A6PDB0_9PEZI|nr:vacuolar membrane PQ loop repeat protein [Lineolata rhizophorae]
MSQAVALAESVPLTAHEALSGVFGSVSLAAWIFLLVPQLVTNYRMRSAEGISLAFLTVWFVGDVTNLVGAVWASLVPTVIALAVYFCFADLVLIAQCVYYNVLNARRAARKASVQSGNGSATAADDDAAGSREEEPLLSRRESAASSIGLPGSHRRRSSATSSARRQHRGSQPRRDSLARIVEEGSGRREWVTNVASIAAVCAVGSVGWVVAWKSGAWAPQPSEEGREAEGMPVGAEVLGYVSAVCYLGARIPQIVKNYRDKSCEGLSLLFFMLSLLGNLTYGAGILCHSIEKEYFLRNLPWLIGSLGTMVEDVTIFAQFRIYGDKSESEAVV